MPQEQQPKSFDELIEIRARAIAREVDRVTGGPGDDEGWMGFIAQARAIAAAERDAGLAVVPARPPAPVLDEGAASLIAALTTEMDERSFPEVAGGCYAAMLGAGDLLRGDGGAGPADGRA